MRIDNRNLRRKFSRGESCEYCGAFKRAVHCAHLWHAGIGGAHRLDIRINMATLCWLCHANHHCGKEPTLDVLLKIVAAREGTTPDAIREEVWRLRRLPKETTREQAGYPVTRHPAGEGADVLPGDSLAGSGFIVATDEG